MVHISPAADDRISYHVNFLKRVSISGALRLYDKFCKELGSLDFNPERCPRYFSSKKAVDDTMFRYKFCAKRHRIVIEIVDDTVYIQDVQDCRQHTNKSLV
ncbi:MAG: type II toxin-antitoxin system RelE/ParE family toxin [Chitinispirillia bacterium]|nr:type II toxin-antitoxin system RelE/ParE family toxin [Chitinispirillia bacterium]